MTRVTKSIIINSPVEKVFEYLSNPEQIMEWQPNVTNIKDITGHGEQQRWIWNYKVMGMSFREKATVARSTLNAERRVDSKGGIPNTWLWKFKTENGGTRLDCEMDYTIRFPLLGKVGELLLLRGNNRIVNTAMVNIKNRMES